MENYIWPSILIYLAGVIIFAILANAAARRKGYAKAGLFTLAAFFFGLPVLVYIASLPDLVVRSAVAELQAKLAQVPAGLPAAPASVSLDPALIAVLTAAVATVMSEPTPAIARPAATTVPSAPAVTPGQVSEAGFTIRQVRRV